MKNDPERGMSVFRFRRFAMTHARSPMKVGTDGVLLGAWAEVTGAGAVLDIGTGCGVVALMLAQRFPRVRIDGIDAHAGAVADAGENFRRSPFADRLRVLHGDFLTYPFSGKYDFVVSNPPFFSEDTLSPDRDRAVSRSAFHLPAEDLARRIAGLLSERGGAAVIYPYRSAERLVRIFSEQGLFLTLRTDVKGSVKHPPKRSLLAFSRVCPAASPKEADVLCLCDDAGGRSAQYSALTREFHL